MQKTPNKHQDLEADVMSWTSILHAYEYWKEHWRAPDDFINIDHVEAFILNQAPKSNEEAVCVLDVISAYWGDARSDGLDRIALNRLRGYLHS